VRKVGVDGVIRTVAGNGKPGFGGDGGPAIYAELNSPGSITISPSGELYIADTNNHRVRKVGVDGVIQTVAGNGESGFGGDGGPAINAKLKTPRGISVSPVGELYIADTFNQRLRKVGLDGVISTVVGTGLRGGYGDQGLAKNAQLNFPFGVFAAAGRVYIVDTLNRRIRQVEVQAIADSTELMRLMAGEVLGVRAKRVASEMGSSSGIGLDAEGWFVRGVFGVDAQVGLDDFFLFADHFGQALGEDGFDSTFDLNEDDRVDMDDFFILADEFGRKVVSRIDLR
jgi:hypothetical protein